MPARFFHSHTGSGPQVPDSYSSTPCQHGPTWADMDRHRPTLADIGRHGPTWTDIVQHGPTRADMDRHRLTSTGIGRPWPPPPVEHDTLAPTSADVLILGRCACKVFPQPHWLWSPVPDSSLFTRLIHPLPTWADMGRHGPTSADIGRHWPTWADMDRHRPKSADIG